MDVQVAQKLFDAIDAATQSQMNNMNAVMSVMSIVFGGLWMVYIQMKALYWYFDGLTVVIKDALFTIFKASVILFMAFSVSWYTGTVIPVVNEFPVWLGNTLAGSNGVNNNLVDGLISSFIESVSKLLDKMEFSPVTNFPKTMLGILALVFLLLGGIPFLLIAVGTLVTLKVAVTLLLILGPIFIAFLLFPQTSHYFWGWAGTLGGFILTQVLFSIVLGLEMNFINSTVIKDGVISTDLLTCLSILLYFGAFTMLATELPGYAASIMGGAPSGGVGGVGGLLGKTMGAGAASRMSRRLGNSLIKRFHNRGAGRIQS